jgi:hypothetical protein
MPAELCSGLGRVGALVKQKDFGKVAQARMGLIIGAGDRSRRLDSDSSRLR